MFLDIENAARSQMVVSGGKEWETARLTMGKLDLILRRVRRE